MEVDVDVQQPHLCACPRTPPVYVRLQVDVDVQQPHLCAWPRTPPVYVRLQVDVDVQLAKCLSLALQAYTNLTSLVLTELNVYDEAVALLAR